MKLKKSIVLGANGYLGLHLAHYMSNYGIETEVFDSVSKETGSTVHCKLVNILDMLDLQRIDWNVDYVFHFAGLTGTYNGFDRYPEYIKANEAGLLNVLTSIRNSPYRPHLIFPSSRLVYKGSEIPIVEDAPKEAKTVYAANKIACELLLEAYRNAFDIGYTIFRICVPYGNIFGTNYSYGTIGFFIDQARKHGLIKLYGDGSLRRTFTHVQDVCNQIITVSLKEISKGEIYNIEGENYSLKEVALLIAEKYGAKVEFTDWPEMDLRIESGHTVFDSKKINAIIQRSLSMKFSNWVNDLK